MSRLRELLEQAAFDARYDDLDAIEAEIEALIIKAQSEVLQAVKKRAPRSSRYKYDNMEARAYTEGIKDANQVWHTAINTVAKERGIE